MENRKKICIIHTGGTFGMSGHPGPLRPDSYSIDILRWIPELDQIASIEIYSPFNIDSSQIDPDRWKEISSFIIGRYHQFAGFVVIHGTDTMAYTAAALSFMLEGLAKPVILTGAQLPLAAVRTDARNNLIDAVILAAREIPEVGVVFNHKLYRGTRIQKQDVWSYDAFNSPNMEPLAEMGLDLKFSSHILSANTKFLPDDRIDSRVIVVRIAPGLQPILLLTLLSQDVRGLVLEAFGTGNLPVSHPGYLEFLKLATGRQIPVLIVSQSPRGAVDLDLYEAGRMADTAGVIAGGDMTVECATVKLMVALGRYANLDQIKGFIHQNRVGERSDKGEEN